MQIKTMPIIILKIFFKFQTIKIMNKFHSLKFNEMIYDV